MATDAVQASVDRLAEELGRSVVINDAAVHLLYASRHFGDEDRVRVQAVLQREADSKVIGYILAQGVAGWTQAGVIPANDELGLRARVCVPLRWRGRLIGLLMVIDADGTLTTSALATVTAAAGDIAALMAAGGDLDGDQQPVPESTILDLIGPEQALRRQALGEILALGVMRHVGAVRALDIAPTRPLDAVTALHFDLAVRTTLSMRLHSALGTQLHVHCHDAAAVLICTGRPIGDKTALDAARVILDRVRDLSAARFSCAAGLGSSVAGLDQAHITAAQARLARRGAAAIQPAGVVTWADLGALSVLLQVPVDELTVPCLPDEVQRLLAAEGGEALARTVKAYLDHAGSAAAASATLHVHRTSLYYRLGRVAELTGLDLTDGKTRLALHAGLTLLELIDSSGS